ncbi:hypothetical protein D3C80_1986600 [compost metagenome]
MKEDQYGRLRPPHLIEPPAPPPMRQGCGKHSYDIGVYMTISVLCIAFGIMCGLKMAGTV